MADTSVETAVNANLHDLQGTWGPYWHDTLRGTAIFVTSTQNLSRVITTDAGVSWINTAITSGQNMRNVAVFSDREVPGLSTDLLSFAWLNAASNEVRFRTIDLGDGTLGTERVIDSGVTIGAARVAHIALTKAANGDLGVAFVTGTEIEFYVSTDGGENWTKKADVFESATEADYCMLFPADVDDGDMVAIFWDISASEISLKMFDASADTWTETTISGGITMTSSVANMSMDGAVRISDKHVLMFAHTATDDTGDDVLTWDLTVDSIASPTVIAKTNILTNTAESGQGCMLVVNQTSGSIKDDVHVAIIVGNPTWNSTTDMKIFKSTDGMGTWDSGTTYQEAAADDIRMCSSGRIVHDSGGFFQPIFYNDDLSELFVNLPNDIPMAAVAAAASLVYHSINQAMRALRAR